MNNGYVLRDATPEDAEQIADHRTRMFADMGLVGGSDSAALKAETVPWIRALLLNHEYKGRFFEQDGEVVAGGGLHLSELGSVPGCVRIGRRGHIANVYTLPAHRRRGLARRLLEEMVSWSEWNGIDQLTLDASADGRRLYGSLGFGERPDFEIGKQALDFPVR